MNGCGLICVILAAGAVLRIALAVALPPERAYDDHFKPVEIILNEKRIPSAADCWECYQPPLYYLVAAATFRATEQLALGSRAPQPRANQAGRRAIQFISVAAGCATLGVCWLILRQLRERDNFGFWILDFGLRKTGNEATGQQGNEFDPSCLVAPLPRCLPPKSKIALAPALAFAAFLPQHIYMSAMVTNDALAYFIASLAIWAALRAAQRDWRLRDWLFAGALAGATVLCKGYGWMTVFAVVGAVGWFSFRSASGKPFSDQSRDRQGAEAGETPADFPTPPLPHGRGSEKKGSGPERKTNDLQRGPLPDGRGSDQNAALQARLQRNWKPFAWTLAAALAVGIWPHVRNLAIYDRFQIDNFDLFDSPMRFQPPGAVREIEFFTFRLAALLQNPWLHVSHVNSFATQLYGRFWFDYEGLQTQVGYPPWEALWRRCQEADPEWNRKRWNLLLAYQPQDAPAGFARVAVVAYIAGLPLTLLIVTGLLLALRRFGRDFAPTLLVLHLVFSLGVPLFQTLRLPHFAAMKAGFALGGLSSAAALLMLCIAAARGWPRVVVLFFAWAGLAAVAVADAAYVTLQF